MVEKCGDKIRTKTKFTNKTVMNVADMNRLYQKPI